MKKLSVLLFGLLTIASAQLRVSLDLNNSGEGSVVVPDDSDKDISIPVTYKSKSPGLRIGYEYTLLTIAGVGVEYTMTGKTDFSGDHEIIKAAKADGFEWPIDKVFPDALSGYGLVRLPVGVPFARGVVRAGMFLPLGSGNLDEGEDGSVDEETFNMIDVYKPGITWGLGVRVKLPLIPIGGELLYQSMSLSFTDDAKNGYLSDWLPEGNVSTFSLVATYSF